MSYERVRYRDEAKTRTVILEDPRELEFAGMVGIIGLRVNRDGWPIPRGTLTYHVVDLDDVVSRTDLEFDDFGQLRTERAS